MSKYFLVGVADYRAYKGQSLVAVGKTNINTSIEISTSNTEIRGGKRNALQYIYYHTGTVGITLETAEWALPLIQANSGGSLNAGADLGYSESIVLASGSRNGTVLHTPVGRDGGVATCWYTYDGITYSAPFSGKNFVVDNAVPAGSTVCAYYYYKENDALQLTIPANFIPDNLWIEFECDLATNKSGSGIIGSAVFVVPSVQLSGAQTINMTSDGYSSTPLSGMALAYTAPQTAGECAGKEVYAWIIQNITDEKWYDLATGLAIEGLDDINEGGEAQLSIRYISEYGSILVPDYADLTFTSDTPAVADVSEDGVIDAISTGTSLITASITNKPSISDNITVTVVS